jgi:hypothetical protein
MSVTVTAKKTVGFRSPYTGKTFQELAELIYGRDGYLSGGSTSDNGSVITVLPAKLVSRGIVGESLENVVGLAVPTLPEPWFLIGSIPDDDPDSGIIFSVTADLVTASTGVIVAFKAGGAWQNPLAVSVDAAFQRAAEDGAESIPFPTPVVSAGDVTGVIQSRGRVVDPDGVRKLLSRASGSSLESLNETFPPGHTGGAREDVVVLRQIEPHTSAVEYLIGPTDDVTGQQILLETGTRPGVFAKRGGDEATERWVSWGEGSALKIKGGFGGAGFAEATLLTGSSTIGNVWLAGQRASDSAILVVYTDGDAVRLASFNASTGALIDAAVTIDTESGNCNNVRAELDQLEKLHVVYEHDEGSEQQVYYTKVVTATASFGTADVTPKIVTSDGLTSSLDDRRPDIALDRSGNAHVVFNSGTPVAFRGNFVYATIDQNGDVTSRRTYLTASEVGRQDNNWTPGVGFTSQAGGDVETCRVMVTPHDEVYAVAVASSDGGGNNELLLFNPDFEERLGFPLVNVMDENGNTGIQNGVVQGADISSNELGQILIIASSVDVDEHYIDRITLDTAYAPFGEVTQLNSALDGGNVGSELVSTPRNGVNSDEGDIVLRRGGLGEMLVCRRMNNTNVNEVQDYGVNVFSRRPTPHPKDVYLSKIVVPKVVSAGDPTPEEDLGLFNTRLKRMNYPFLVGDGGEYQGYRSLVRAVQAANQAGGGTVIVRPGDYRNHSGFGTSGFTLYSGVSLIGEAKVSLSGFTINLGEVGGHSGGITGGNLWERSGAPIIFRPRPGDLMELTSGFHRVLRELPPNATHGNRALLSNAADGTAPSGSVINVFPAGIRLENIAFSDLDTASAVLVIWKSDQLVIKNVSFHGRWNNAAATSGIMACNTARSPLLEGLDFVDLERTAAGETAITFNTCIHPVVRGCMADPSHVHVVRMDQTNENPSISNCPGMRVEPETAARTTPLFLGGAGGADASNLASGQNVVTTVGQVVKTEPGMGGMYFQDENTRAGGTPNIPFSDSGTDGDELPAGANSVLHGIHSNRDDIDQNATDIGDNATDIATEITNRTNADTALQTQMEEYGEFHDAAGVLEGLAPSAGTGTQLDFALGKGVAQGKYFSVAAGSETAATSANTTYFYYFDGDGNILKTTGSPYQFAPIFTDKCYIAEARTNGTNNGFTYVTDYRRLINAGNLKTPIIVADPDTQATLANFFSLHAAVNWLSDVVNRDRNPRCEIIITELLDYTNGEASINPAPHPTSGFGHLTIRGEGANAGILWGQNTPVFNSTSGSGAPALGDAEMTTLRISNLIIKPSGGHGEMSAWAIVLTTGWIGRCTIDNIKLIHNATDSVFRGLIQWNKDADHLLIADNYIEGHHLEAIDINGTQVNRMEILRNRCLYEDTSAGGNYAISISSTGIKDSLWIVGNMIEPGPTNSHPPEGGITVSVNPVNPNIAGGLFIMDNLIDFGDGVQTESNAIFVTEANAGEGVSVVISGNAIYGKWDTGIEIAGTVSDIPRCRIINNYVEAEAASFFDACIHVGQDHTVVANNVCHLVSTESVSNGSGILIEAHKVACVGNTVRADNDARSGIGVDEFGGTGGYDHITITGNSIEGSFSQAAIWIFMNATGNHISVTGNSIHAVGGFGIRAQGCTYFTLCGNTIECDAGTGISIENTCARYVISGNVVICTSTSSVKALDINAWYGVITGNFFQHLTPTVTTDGTVVDINGGVQDIVFTGNVVRAREAADYGDSDPGSRCLTLEANDCVVTGNHFYNRGTHNNKATIKVQAGSHAILGNVIRNNAAGAVHIWDNASTAEWGTAGGADPGANEIAT